MPDPAYIPALSPEPIFKKTRQVFGQDAGELLEWMNHQVATVIEYHHATGWMISSINFALPAEVSHPNLRKAMELFREARTNKPTTN